MQIIPIEVTAPPKYIDVMVIPTADDIINLTRMKSHLIPCFALTVIIY